MKTTIWILILCLGFLNHPFAQVTDNEIELTPQELYDLHIKKSQGFQTGGWIAVTGGMLLIAAGSHTDIVDCFLEDFCLGKMALISTGAGLGISSIVLFSAAAKHKKKARFQLQKGAVAFNNKYKYAGLSITFSF